MKDPMIGQQIANFRIERLLGQGGMATVYYGQDVKLHRSVAIKFIDKRYRNNPVYASRFVNEARMMAKWRHENLIQIYYADDTQGYSYYAMEYVDGDDLSKVMAHYQKNDELMPIEDVLRIGKSIASALDYAHRQGVVHRDVKPSNVLLSKDARVLLGDFGLALDVGDGSMGSIFGTPHYISPEQARRSSDATPQSDLYSLGVILYEILTGAVPFNDPSPASVALQHISTPPPPPRSINPDLSPAVESVILKALDKDPKNRYQTGEKLLSALEDALNSKESSQKMSLPPLPVGVPTIVSGNRSIEQIIERASPKNNADQPLAAWPATVKAGSQPRKKNGWLILIVLILFGIGAWYLSTSGFLPMNVESTQTFISTPLSSTETPVPPTPTLIPPSASSTVALETASPTTLDLSAATLEISTATLVPLPTLTQLPLTLAVSGSPAIPSVSAVPTIKYPDGYHFTLYWNETSFYMQNNSRARRTLSAFSFERLDEAGEPMGSDIFVGYDWETSRFNYIPANLCVGITLYENQNPPYLNPPECVYGYLRTYQIRNGNDSGLIFWTAKESSTQFRVVWLNEEIARCDLSAGRCDFYTPQ